jgi:hypothetical protein
VTGLKSGSGDDLWGDDGDDAPGNGSSESSESSGSTRTDTDAGATAEPGTDVADESADGDAASASGSTASTAVTADDGQPYIVRRAVRDKSVQFERDERLTFFVHDDVADGERDLLADVEGALGRSVPKFDLREAVYRAALRNREDVLAELVRMGYTEE